jgi:hypothetical protein
MEAHLRAKYGDQVIDEMYDGRFEVIYDLEPFYLELKRLLVE